jgi:hypothetical protein
MLAACGATPAFGQALGPIGRVSFTPPEQSTAGAADVAVAYATRARRYLAVWQRTGESHSQELFARVVTGSGVGVGAERQVTFAGGPRMSGALAGDPALAYNPRSRQFLVVWRDRSATNFDVAIYAQRLTIDGTPVGGPVMVPRGPWPSLGQPAVAADPVTGNYLVAWTGGRSTAYENQRVFAQRLTFDAGLLGRGTQVSPRREIAFLSPGGVAFDPRRRSFVVVWRGLPVPGAPAFAKSIELRRVQSRSDRMSRPVRIFRRTREPEGGVSQPPVEPAIAVNARADRYFVVWGYASELWARLVRGHGPHGDGRPHQLSTTRAHNDLLTAAGPAVAFDRRHSDYLVVWSAACDPPTPGTGAGCPEESVLGQRVSATGRPVGRDDFAISALQPAGRSTRPAVAYHSARREFLVAWQGPASEKSACQPLFYGQACEQKIEIFARRARAGQ